MSLSTDNSPSFSRSNPSAKTPPPAPSAAYAKRFFFNPFPPFFLLTLSSTEPVSFKQSKTSLQHGIGLLRCALSHLVVLLLTRFRHLSFHPPMPALCLLLITRPGLEGPGLEPYLPMFSWLLRDTQLLLPPCPALRLPQSLS